MIAYNFCNDTEVYQIHRIGNKADVGYDLREVSLALLDAIEEWKQQSTTDAYQCYIKSFRV